MTNLEDVELRARLDGLGPAPRTNSCTSLGNPKTRTFAELLLDLVT